MTSEQKSGRSAVTSNRGLPIPAARLGRFDLGPQLGRGATSDVYMAHIKGPSGVGTMVALKVMLADLMRDTEARHLFLEEAHLSLLFSHPNLAHAFEFSMEGPRWYLAGELLRGQTLAAVCERARLKGISIPADLAAWIGARAADGLHHAHTCQTDDGRKLGVVHRDVCPHNIMVTYDGQVKVIDFGIARSERCRLLDEKTILRGRFRYMAPEIVLGGDYDHRVDVFGLGATVYELVLGEPAFEGRDELDVLESVVVHGPQSSRMRQANVPVDLLETLRAAMSMEPGARQNTAAELSTELDRVVARCGGSEPQRRLAALLEQLFDDDKRQLHDSERALSDRPVRTTIPTRRWGHRAGWAGIVAAAIALLALLAWVIARW